MTKPKPSKSKELRAKSKEALARGEKAIEHADETKARVSELADKTDRDRAALRRRNATMRQWDDEA